MLLLESAAAVMRGGQKIHITMIDLKASAMARFIVMFELLLRYFLACIMHRNDKDAGQWYVLMLSYLFAGFVLPPEVDEKLRDIIVGLAKSLEEDPGKPIHESLYVHPSAVPEIIRHLKSWSQVAEGVYTKTVRAAGMRHTAEIKMETGRVSRGNKKAFANWNDDCKVFDQFGIILPPKRFLVKIEPALDKVISNFLAKPRSPNAIKAVDDYLDGNWKPNMTLFDMDWELARKSTTEYLGADLDDFVQLNCDAPALAAKLLGSDEEEFNPNGKSVIDWIQEFFSSVGKSMHVVVGGNTTIEMMVGEMSDFMDRLAHDALPHRRADASKAKGGQGPSKFPKVYDCIHLSNIP
jgi:hypothetical protein